MVGRTSDLCECAFILNFGEQRFYESSNMPLILVRIDDPDYKIELVRWQPWPHGRNGFSGFWGYTQTMLDNHRAPAMFPDSVWQLLADETKEGV
jgi:hypothetical protein